jgi:hypothetical protein
LHYFLAASGESTKSGTLCARTLSVFLGVLCVVEIKQAENIKKPASALQYIPAGMRIAKKRAILNTLRPLSLSRRDKKVDAGNSHTAAAR